MRKFNYQIGLIAILVCFLVIPPNAFSKEKGKNSKNSSTTIFKTGADPAYSIMDINGLTAWVKSDGAQGPQIGGSWNGQFPKGYTIGAIYQEGIVWGGQVNDGASPTIRTGGNTYRIGTNNITRLYRVRPDYKTANLVDDAGNFFQVNNSDVSSGQIDQIYNQYEKDWNEYGAVANNYGAPYEDKNNDGMYDPAVDIPGIPGASQTIFICYDDSKADDIYGTPPIGLEVHETFWGYAISNPLGNVIFKKVNVIYKGAGSPPQASSVVDSMYLVQWADPDLGNSGDDFAGSDSLLGLGYVYNSVTTDSKYLQFGLAPPAGGYDFLQGVASYTGNASDSAIVNLKWRTGYKFTNYDPAVSFPTPLSTFVYFAAGGAWDDPTFDLTGAQEWYNLMRGYQSEAVQTVFPASVTNKPQGGDGTYLLSGDPVNGTGQIDGSVDGPGDRRICNVTGPFTFHKGDTVEVVTALIAGLGSNNVTSVAVLKFNDRFAQYAYDNLFDLPIFPQPTLQTAELDKKLLLNWGTDDASIKAIEQGGHAGYAFQGYNVYQYPTAASGLTDAKRVATFDLIDGVTVILDDQLDQSTGVIIQQPVQVGKNTGIKRFLEVTTDAFSGGAPLINGQKYYFAVTAYGYNPSTTVPFHALESSPVKITLTPHNPNPGIRYQAALGDTISVVHSAGAGDGVVYPIVVDPTKLTGKTYKVTYQGSGASTTWTLTSGTDTLLQNQANQSGDGNYIITDGIMTKVQGPPLDFADFYVTANAGGTVDPPAGIGADYYNFPGLGRTNIENQQVNGSTWLIFSSNTSALDYADWKPYVTRYSGGFGEANQGIGALVPDDFEFRFTATGSKGDVLSSGATYGDIINLPFEIWDVADPGDPSDDFQVYCEVGDANANGVFDFTGTDHPGSGASNDPYTDYITMIVPRDRTPGSAGYNALLTYATNNAPFGDAYPWAYLYGPPEYPSDPFASYPGIMNLVFMNWNGGTIPGPYNATMLEQGTVVHIATTKPSTTADEFTFTAPSVTNNTSLAKTDVEKINVFPNPYYGYSNSETSRQGHFVTFNHLPQKATIRIFDLAGVQVTRLQKDDPSQFITWNMTNQNNYPVASGIYVVYIDMPDLGQTKILKFAMIQEEQILNVY